MTDKKIGAIRVDWFNMRVEFSPNINILSKKSQSMTGGDDIEETILNFEIFSDQIQPGKPEYKAYVLETDSIQDDEPFDLDDPWYKQEGAAEQASPAKPAPKQIATPTPTPPAPAESTTAPTPVETPEDNLSPEAKKQLIKLEAQLDSIKKMVAKIDIDFKEGTMAQEAYLKKKNYLAEKMGALMGQIEQIKN